MRRDRESGYALLLVFLMAAVIAITLYSEIPRVAFQSQRQKEQMLVERGEQYKRAIQVFYATTKQWPRNLDDLEKYQNRRFLRHKYVDPMTGESEWRLVHVQGNMLTDSLVFKNKGEKENASAATESNYISSYPGMGQDAGGAQGARPQDRRRASEGGPGGDTALPGGFPGGPAYGSAPPQPGEGAMNPNQPGGMQPIPYPGAQPVPGQPAPYPGAQPVAGQPAPYPGAQPVAGQPYPYPGAQPVGQPYPAGPGQPYPGAQAGGLRPGGLIPVPPGGNPGQPGQGSIVAPGQQAMPIATGQQGGQGWQQGVTGSVQGVYPGQPGYPQQTGSGSPTQNAATRMIGQILTTARPQGAPMPGQSGTALGGGLAGVASKAEMEGIMVYEDRTAYNEWEFIFDPAKVMPLPQLGGSSSGPSSQPGGRGGPTTSMSGSTLSGLGFGSGPAQPGSPGRGGTGGGRGSAGGLLQQPGGGRGGPGQGPAGMQTGGGFTGSGQPTIRMGRP